MTPDFDVLDLSFRTSYKEDRTKKAQQLGYTNTPEAIYQLYYIENKSLQEVATLLDYSSDRTIHRIMEAWNWKRRSVGGANYKGKKK